MLLRQDLAVGVRRCDEVTPVVGHDDVDLDLRPGQALIKAREQLLDPLTRVRGHDESVWLAPAQSSELQRIGDVGLVDDDELGQIARTDLG